MKHENLGISNELMYEGRITTMKDLESLCFER